MRERRALRAMRCYELHDHLCIDMAWRYLRMELRIESGMAFACLHEWNLLLVIGTERHVESPTWLMIDVDQ